MFYVDWVEASLARPRPDSGCHPQSDSGRCIVAAVGAPSTRRRPDSGPQAWAGSKALITTTGGLLRANYQYRPWRTGRGQLQGLSQRPVQPSFGRPIFSLDVGKDRQIPPYCFVRDPRLRPRPTISKFGLPFLISWLSPWPAWY